MPSTALQRQSSIPSLGRLFAAELQDVGQMPE